MTSHVIENEDEPLKCALGVHYEMQLKALNDALHLFKTMKFSGHPKKFLYGGIFAINGVIDLHNHLKTVHNVPYLRTAYVNQDSLESFFGQMREQGGCDRHPSALHLLYRIKKHCTTALLEDRSFNVLENKHLFECDEQIPDTQTDFSDPFFNTLLDSEIVMNETEKDGLESIADKIIFKMRHLEG